jgi:hypothetical protein
MIVRNRLFKKNELLGMDTDASDEKCPCRKCYHPHDFGYRLSTGEMVKRIVCLYREQFGCPSPKPIPDHVLGKNKKCKRCRT